MRSNDLDEIGQQLEMDARSWIEQEKPLELLYEGERFDLAKEWVRQYAVSVEAWEFFEACIRWHECRNLWIDIAHEFRTPLYGIKGGTELLIKESNLPSEKRDHLLSFMQEVSIRMVTIIDEQLDRAVNFTGKAD